MIEVNIPGFNKLQFNHLVLDYNGTLAFDGVLIEGVRERLRALSNIVQIHILTADTFGNVKKELNGIPGKLFILPTENQNIEKMNYINDLGAQNTVCIGNGRNDSLMLKKAAIGIAVIQQEGTAVEAIMAADIVVPGIIEALDLLKNTLRLKATLRS